LYILTDAQLVYQTNRNAGRLPSCRRCPFVQSTAQQFVCAQFSPESAPQLYWPEQCLISADSPTDIRLSIRELQAQLDPSRFWQIHRSTIVRVDAIARASRDDSGRITLTLKQSPHRLAVSKPYAHLFRQM